MCKYCLCMKYKSALFMSCHRTNTLLSQTQSLGVTLLDTPDLRLTLQFCCSILILGIGSPNSVTFTLPCAELKSK